MNRRRSMTVQQREEVRIYSKCPQCGSELLTQNNRKCLRSYPCHTGPHLEKDCVGCHDFQSEGRTVVRLKCLDCGHEFEILRNY